MATDMTHLQIGDDGVYQDEDDVVGVAGADVGGDLTELHTGDGGRLCRHRYSMAAAWCQLLIPSHIVSTNSRVYKLGIVPAKRPGPLSSPVRCLMVLCDPRCFFSESINCFFLECRCEQGAPLSAFTISSRIF